MITKEEWDKMFLNLVPVASTAVGTLSVVLGILALQRAGPLGQKAYNLDGQYSVSVRYGQWHDPRDFVQPDNPDVLAVFSQFGSDTWSLYNFICKNINYRLDWGEFWQTPSETLARGGGDCEDSSLLLTSLLRNFSDAHVALGSYGGLGHAWVASGQGEVLEATFTQARPVPDPEDYCAYVLFNDQEVIELWPGALGEVFELGRDEATKLNLMRRRSNHGY